MPFYKRFSGSALLKEVGEDEGGMRRSTGERGHLTYGPYLALEPGDYAAAFYIRRSGPVSGQTIQIDVCDAGAGEIAGVRLLDSELFTSIAGQVFVNFSLTKPAEALEVRMHVDAGVNVEVHYLVLFSVEYKRWAA